MINHKIYFLNKVSEHLLLLLFMVYLLKHCNTVAKSPNVKFTKFSSSNSQENKK